MLSSSTRPPSIDAAEWRALADAVAKQPTPPRAAWRTHSRLKAALSEAAGSPSALLLAHDRLLLPWRSDDGVWHNMPLGAGAPCCVKRFLCVPSLEDWLHYERTLPPHSRCFYEVLRERTPVRYWLDLDLPASGALLAQLGVASAHACRDRLAELLQRAALGAVCDVMQAAPAELRARCVDGNGAGREACERISLHLLVDGALLPDNEHAAAAVRLAVIDRIRVAARDGDAAAAALVRCAHIESAIDRVNTKNRLRRLTGHTKLGQARWSHPMQCEEGTPASAFFVSGAAAGAGVHVLQWRVAAVCSAPIAALRERKAAAEPADVSADVGATITAELSAIALLAPATTAARVLPPSAQFPCWTAFTTCRTCPWRAHDTPAAGRVPGPMHRSARMFVTFFRDRVEVGCTAARHIQRIPRAYAHAGSKAVLFPDAHAVLAQMAQMDISPPRVDAPAPAWAEGQENGGYMVMSPFVLQHADDIFTPRFCARATE